MSYPEAAWQRFLVAALLALLAACGQGRDGVSVGSPWARATPPGAEVGAVYLRLRNDGAETRRLLRVESDAADKAEIHAVSHAGGMVGMHKLPDGLELAPGASQVFEPGGIHVMLMGLRRPLRPGEVLRLRLHLDGGEVLEIEVPVRSAAP